MTFVWSYVADRNHAALLCLSHSIRTVLAYGGKRVTLILSLYVRERVDGLSVEVLDWLLGGSFFVQGQSRQGLGG